MRRRQRTLGEGTPSPSLNLNLNLPWKRLIFIDTKELKIEIHQTPTDKQEKNHHHHHDGPHRQSFNKITNIKSPSSTTPQSQGGGSLHLIIQISSVLSYASLRIIFLSKHKGAIGVIQSSCVFGADEGRDETIPETACPFSPNFLMGNVRDFADRDKTFDSFRLDSSR